jgi:hypothetical protein
MPGLFAAVYAQWAGPVGDAFVRAKQLVDWAVTSVSSSRLSGQVCKFVGGWSGRGVAEVEAGGAVEGVFG